MIIVTGVRGYLGSLVYEKLKKDGKHTVVGISRQDVDLEDNYEVLKFFTAQNDIERIETVIHCASAGNSVTPTDDFTIIPANVKMMQNILSSIDTSNVRFILPSSGAMRNRSFAFHIDVEEYLRVPTDAYGLSKYLCWQMAVNLPNFLGIVIYGLFGDTEPEYRFFKSVITNALRGDPIYVYDATSIMDFEYTPNLVNFISDVAVDNSWQGKVEVFRPERDSLYGHAICISEKCYAYKQKLINSGVLIESNPYYATGVSSVNFSDKYKPKFKSSYIAQRNVSLRNSMLGGAKLLSLEEGIDEMICKLAPTILGVEI